MDYALLRERAMAVHTGDLSPETDIYLIGVVQHTITKIDDIVDSSNLLWAQATGRTKIEKIKSTYLKLASSNEQPKLKMVYFAIHNQNLDEQTPISAINHFHDRLIILQASLLPAKCNFQFSEAIKNERNEQKASQLPSPPCTFTSASPQADSVPEQDKTKREDTSMLMSEAHDDEDDDSPVDDSDHDADDNEITPDSSINAREFFTAVDQKAQQIMQDDDLRFDSSYLSTFKRIDNIHRLEDIVNQGLKKVAQLETTLEKVETDDTEMWLDKLEDIRELAAFKRTVVGIVGNTGAGKSSVINALLGEEKLVPTNCMRACTAVVTELAWNRSEDASAKYRAEVEFISESEWLKDLEILQQEVKDAGSNAIRADSAAGIAMAKVQAVYPTMNKDTLASTDLRLLSKRTHVRKHLGTTKYIKAANARTFYCSLQVFVDGKQKESNRGNTKQATGNAGNSSVPEFWPLIKCVRIYLKAEALSTGAVLVDLPGVQDSNPARAAVADGYMKECSGLWIVAPITRAVNDKAAKTLLGDQFRRQLQRDGQFSNVTFICSKTDEIAEDEAIESLGLEELVDKVKIEQQNLEKQKEAAEEELQVVNQHISDSSSAVTAAFAEKDTWSNLLRRFKKGHPVFPPSNAEPRKRNSNRATTTESRKRTKLDRPIGQELGDDANIFLQIDEDDDDDDEAGDALDNGHVAQITEEDIRSKLVAIKLHLGELKQTGTQLCEQKNELSDQITDLGLRKEDLNDRPRAICIQARNEWSQYQIQDDFAKGVQELEEQCAEEEDEDNFNPDNETRDYSAVARSLPVFCVSSHAYQFMLGRQKGKKFIGGYPCIEDTGMPQLLQHCLKMTENNRFAAARYFLEEFTKLLFSLSVWSSSDGSGVKMSDAERETECSVLSRRLDSLITAMEEAGDTMMADIQKAQKQHVGKLCSRAVNFAVGEAPPIVDRWPRGLHWMTFKAILRRGGGPYTDSKKTPYNFNNDLSEPFETKLTSGWANCFQSALPKIFQGFSKSLYLTLEKFHQATAKRAETRGVGLAGVETMGRKKSVWKTSFNTETGMLKEVSSAGQKDVNRDLACPEIAKAMEKTYKKCLEETGKGSVKRMKLILEERIMEKEAKKMYQKCSRLVHSQLKVVREKIEAKKDEIIDKVTQEIRRDYMNVVMGRQIGDQKMTRAERKVRAALHFQIREVGKLFTNLAISNTVDLLDEEEKNMKAEAEAAAKEEIRAREEQDAEVVLAEEWVDQVSPEELAAKSQAAVDASVASKQPADEEKVDEEATGEDDLDGEGSASDEDGKGDDEKNAMDEEI